MLYFSYGSNMSVKRLTARAPSAQIRSVATLFGHELRFHKKSKDGSVKCDAFETCDSNHCVIGVVYEIAEIDKLILDEKEGLGYGYEQKTVKLTAASGEVLSAYTYYATNIDSELKPYDWYVHHVLTGAREHGLPVEYVDKISSILSVTDPDQERHKLEMEIYADKRL